MGIAEELASLRARLKARDGKPGFKSNVQEIRERIAQLEARQ